SAINGILMYGLLMLTYNFNLRSPCGRCKIQTIKSSPGYTTLSCACLVLDRDELMI
ncbi:hypothetical protein HN51_059041, partial [Arachis hypogaea]